MNTETQSNSADIVRNILSDLHVSHDSLRPIFGSKTEVFVVEGAGLVAKVSATYADCLEKEAANIESVQRLSNRSVRLPADIPALHRMEDTRVLFTRQLIPTGLVNEANLPHELDMFLTDIHALTLPLPTWIEQHQLTVSRLQITQDSSRDYLEQMENRFIRPTVEQDWQLVPLHGDAYAANALQTKDGVVWLDLEDMQLGPRPLAFSLLQGEEMPHVDDKDLQQFRIYRAWGYAVWEQSMQNEFGSDNGRAMSSLLRLKQLIDNQ